MKKLEQKARDRVLDAVAAMAAVAAGMEAWNARAGWVSDARTAQDVFDRALAAYRRAILADAKK